jgi:hypothetical protein
VSEFEEELRKTLQASIASMVGLFDLALTAGFQAGVREENKGTNPLKGKNDPDADLASAFWDNGWEIGQAYLRNTRTEGMGGNGR